MPLDADTEALLARVAASRRPLMHTLSPADARTAYRETRRPLQPDPPDVASVEDRRVPGPRGPIGIRVYRPHGAAPSDILAALVYFHGGGFMIGDLDTHDVLCRSLANGARIAIVAVDYRLGPEHRFPAAVDDAIGATAWVAAHANELAIDPTRLAVGGDSAGGNLAAVVSIAARDAGGPPLAFQLLIYPTTSLDHDTASARRLAQGYLLTIDLMHYFRGNYLNGAADREDWRASPLAAADLSRLPPALIVTAGYDPLCDEGRAYADRLIASGVPVEYVCYDGTVHGFILMGRVLRVANEAVDGVCVALKRALGSGELRESGDLAIESSGDLRRGAI